MTLDTYRCTDSYQTLFKAVSTKKARIYGCHFCYGATNAGNTRLHINCQSIHISLCQNKLIYRYLNCIWKYSNYWIFPLKWTNNLLVIPFVLLFDFKEKCWKTSKNAWILLPSNWNFSGLGWWILDFSKPVGQGGFGAHSESELASQFL